MDEPIKKISTRWSKRREELDQLLGLAEMLKQRCEDNIARRERMRLLQFMSMGMMSAILVLAMAMASFSARSDRSFTDRYIFMFASFAFLPLFVGFFLYFNRMLGRYRRWFLTDSTALKEVVRLLRETEGAMLGTSNWSAVDRARFHIQLARFSIGDEFEDDYGQPNKQFMEEVRAYSLAKQQSANATHRNPAPDA